HVIHRDIKPANIMLADNGEVKILDFGIAKLRDAKKDLTGNTVLGTPYYMSPEQAMGQPIDARTDLYSLGITAFHLLTGKKPFEAKSKVDVMLMQVKTPLPSIHDSAQCAARAVGGVVVVGVLLAVFMNRAPPAMRGRVPVDGWKSLEGQKKLHAKGFGNCVFSSDDSGGVQSSFTAAEPIHGRCYLPRQVG